LADDRSLLKALDRELGEEDTKRQLRTNRILEGISTHIKSIESFELQSVITPGNLNIPPPLLMKKRAPSSSQNLISMPNNKNDLEVIRTNI
jgi:hypothetical protein